MADTTMQRPDVLMCALAARLGGQRWEDWADGANFFARPFPDAPWVLRGLPISSAAWPHETRPGMLTVDGGHEGHRNDFPITPPPEPWPVRRHFTSRAARRLSSLSGHDEIPREWVDDGYLPNVEPDDDDEPLVLGDVPPLDGAHAPEATG